MELAEKLFIAIKKNDLNAFNALMEEAPLGTLRLGRFPVLSLLYLYRAKKLISAYERKFIKYNSWQELKEPAPLSPAFSSRAGKCLRFYLDEVVSPLEMLLILNETARLKKVFPLAQPTPSVKKRLKELYAVKYALEVEYEGDRILMQRRPRTRSEKRRLVISVASLSLAAVIGAGIPIGVWAATPHPVIGEDGRKYYTVSKLKDIDFASDNVYTLTESISLPQDFYCETVNCELRSSGKTVSVTGETTAFGTVTGTITDISFSTLGTAPLIDTIAVDASIKNVGLNVNVSSGFQGNGAFLAASNYGTVEGVVMRVNGTLSATGDASELKSDGYLWGGLVLANYQSYDFANFQTRYGLIKGCTASYNGFTLQGEVSSNASFGGIVAVNNSYVDSCTVTGEISSNTLDVAGICVTNNFLLTNNVNTAFLSQTTENDSWNPLVAGIVINNSSATEVCVNRGSITAISTSDSTAHSVMCAGIAIYGYDYILNCKNSGALTASGKGEVFAGGIGAISYMQLTGCVSSGNITASGSPCYVGGILAFSGLATGNSYVYFGMVKNCVSGANLTANSMGEPSFLGGLIGFVNEQNFNIQNVGERYLGGGVTGSYFTGTLSKTGTVYRGAVAGAAGKNIHDANSYLSGNAEYRNFEGNYFIAGEAEAIGTVFTVDAEKNRSYYNASGLGATALTMAELTALEGYKEIMKN